jgi:excisionase family DNA binding protein
MNAENGKQRPEVKKRRGRTAASETCSIPEAGERLGLSRNGAYEAARRGEIPVLKFGRLRRVPVAALNRMLAGDAR